MAGNGLDVEPTSRSAVKYFADVNTVLTLSNAVGQRSGFVIHSKCKHPTSCSREEVIYFCEYPQKWTTVKVIWEKCKGNIDSND